MTLAAVFECQVAAKDSPSVVTRSAGLAARGDEVLRGRGRTDLSRLRRSGSQLVTVDAREPVSWTMFGVTECIAIGARVGGRRSIRFLLVTDAARRDLASGGRLARRCMT